jgi:alkylresorcinol/alkylpyrone synthase
VSPSPRIAAVATALPPHRLDQAEAKAGAREAWGSVPDLERLLVLFDRCGVSTRYLAFPKSYYLTPRSFGDRNRDYIAIAQDLGETAARRALDRAGLGPGDVTHFLVATTTGLATPSLDALLAHRLGLGDAVRRIPLFGLGCAGGAGGVALAAEHLRARPGGVALVLAVELCSLTLLIKDASKVNLVGSALFGDGAACAVLTGGDRVAAGAEVAAAETALFPGSSHLMGWNFSEEGFGLLLSPEVPAFIARELPARLTGFLDRAGFLLDEVRHYALHPGGRQVLEAYRRGLGLSEEALASTRGALRDYGNLSSASVLFSLERAWRDRPPRPGDVSLLAAMGPGFAAEMVLTRWRE